MEIDTHKLAHEKFELEEKLNITDCTEELKFTPKDISPENVICS